MAYLDDTITSVEALLSKNDLREPTEREGLSNIQIIPFLNVEATSRPLRTKANMFSADMNQTIKELT